MRPAVRTRIRSARTGTAVPDVAATFESCERCSSAASHGVERVVIDPADEVPVLLRQSIHTADRLGAPVEVGELFRI